MRTIPGWVAGALGVGALVGAFHLGGRVGATSAGDTPIGTAVSVAAEVAAPPDHSHFPQRLRSRFVREVCFVDGSWETVPLQKWSEFASQQVDLLVEAGFTREHAQQLYDEVR